MDKFFLKTVLSSVVLLSLWLSIAPLASAAPNPVPSIASITPPAKNAGDLGFAMTVVGSGFVSSSVVRFNDSNRTTTYDGATQLSAAIPASDLTTPGTFNITVFNPTPGGGTSNTQPFTVQNGVPMISTIDPTSGQLGNSVQLVVNGGNFVSSSVIYWDSLAIPTTYLSSTQIMSSGTIQLTSVGIHYISVVNPAPGGGSSNSQTFNVYDTNAPPTIGTMSVSGAYCPFSGSTGIAYFSWNYNDAEGDKEYQFQLQITSGSDAGFSSPVIDRTYSSLSNPSPTTNQQAVMVQTQAGNNAIVYNTSYLWRVKVWQEDPSGLPGADSGWVQGATYTTNSHAGPAADFTFTPAVGTLNQQISFTNASKCYDNNGSVIACNSYLWTFGDGSGTSQQNPNHSYNTTGTFTVTLQASDGGGSCQMAKTIQVCNAISADAKVRWYGKSPFPGKWSDHASAFQCS